MSYYSTVTHRSIENDESMYCENSQDIEAYLKDVGMPAEYREGITAVVVLVWEGDLIAMWLTESGRPFDLRAFYHPLPYYRPESWLIDRLPSYWLESNEYYQ